MPGVKKLYQESEKVTKPEWIRSHYFGAISLLLKAGSCFKAVPVTLELQDGIKSAENDETTLCVQFITTGSYIIFDACFAFSKKLIQQFGEHKLHLITRVRISTVGKQPLPAPLVGTPCINS